MDKIIYLAVAGSGKTYDLCNSINENGKNIIIAFTNQNINNIQRELINKFGYIPKETDILTFHSFIYKDFIMPFEYIVWDKIDHLEPKVKTKGISIIEPPNASNNVEGRRVPNRNYIKDHNLGHYIDGKSKKYYCGRMSKLINKCGINGIIKNAIERLQLYYDNLYIDEFQDFRDNDYKLLNEIVKRISLNCYLYGDFYQHSVSGTNNSGLPFSKYDTYEKFTDELIKNGYVIDSEKLKNSRRCSNNICEYVREELNINIYSCNYNNGSIVYLNSKEEIKRVIEDDNIIKLFYSMANKQPCKAINWGYSKGDTYNEICIIKPKRLDINSKVSKNKYYVALTRSESNVYILKKEQYEEYIKEN